MSDRDHIFEAAMRLPDDQRAELVGRLLRNDRDARNSSIDEACPEEIRRRLAELDNGDVTTIPWRQARAMILGKTV